MSSTDWKNHSKLSDNCQVCVQGIEIPLKLMAQSIVTNLRLNKVKYQSFLKSSWVFHVEKHKNIHHLDMFSIKRGVWIGS